jgi:hypothetical protein
MKISVAYEGAVDSRVDAKIRRAAGMLIKYLGSAYEVKTRKRDLQFSATKPSEAYDAAQRIKGLPFNLDVLVH